ASSLAPGAFSWENHTWWTSDPPTKVTHTDAIEMSGSNGPFKAPRQGGPDGDESTRARRPGGYEPSALGRADTERGRGTPSLERAASASHSTTPGGRGRRRSGSSAAGATVESAAQRETPRRDNSVSCSP